MKGREVVGHVSRKVSRMCAVFLRNGGTIKCTVSGSCCYSHDLPQGDMEIPCILGFFGEEKWLKISKLIKELGLTTEVKEEKIKAWRALTRVIL